MRKMFLKLGNSFFYSVMSLVSLLCFHLVMRGIRDRQKNLKGMCSCYFLDHPVLL